MEFSRNMLINTSDAYQVTDDMIGEKAAVQMFRSLDQNIFYATELRL